MWCSSTNIHFDYGGHYSKSEDDYEWIPTDGRLYAISFKTSSLICKKMGINPFKKMMNLSYIPLVVESKRQSYILDDEDVFVYLTSVDIEQRKCILHVEDIKNLVIVSINEQLSRVEKESSYGRNYSESECESRYEEAKRHKEYPHKKHKRK
ncbi:hypothetical protein N665_0825s0005 [Sinapis alba]|nr:hypothetical protein N665_0825s0005 [Sinapis alba]